MYIRETLFKRTGLVLLALIISGFCRSVVADIGVVDTEAPKTSVLYEDGGKVYLKICQPPVAPPLTRDCESVETPKSVALNDYLYKLPYEVGAYPRTDSGLRLAQKALDDAQKGGASEAVVNRLKRVSGSLEKILKVRDDLKAAQQNHTSNYEYQDEFAKLQVPFGGGSSPIGMNFVVAPAGTFLMGSPSDEVGRWDRETIHRVKISYNYEVQTTKVTQEQWYKVMGDNPSKFSREEDCPNEFKQVQLVAMCPNNPVERVSWNDAQTFIGKLNGQEGQYTYRLPTEAEWEYAARAGSTGPYSVSGAVEGFGWYSANSGSKTHPVAQLEPNRWGLYDVHGNVWEWVADWYGDYPSSDVTDPTGPASGYSRVMRGGSWYYVARRYLRSAFRLSYGPDSRFSDVGFRLVRTPK